MGVFEFGLTFVGLALMLFVVIPIVGIVLWTAFDIVFRVDILWSKLFWAAVVLAVPVAGLLIYWMTRPKRYDPLYEKGDYYEPVQRRRRLATATQVTATEVALPGRPALTLVPKTTPEESEAPAPTLGRAA